jgi:transglutaminase superfamily protein
MRSAIRLTPSDAVVVAEALLLVPFAAASSRLAPLPRAVSIMCRIAQWLPIGPRDGGHETARIVNGATSRVGARCLTRALVLNAVLSRTGIPSQVVVGASRHDGQLKSHAWVERDGESLLGSTAGWETVWRSAS